MNLSSKRFRDYTILAPSPFTWSSSILTLMRLEGIRVGIVEDHTYTFPESDGDNAWKLYAWIQEALTRRHGPNRSLLYDTSTGAEAVLSSHAEYRRRHGTPKPQPSVDLTECSAAEWLVTLLMPRLPESSYESPGDWSTTENNLVIYWWTLQSHCHQRRFFILGSTRDNEEYIGLGPQLTVTGDIVVLSPRIRLPVVLRPAGDHYRLLGCCYIPAVEIIRENYPEYWYQDRNIESFWIC
jgi:hypothetical protein